MSSSSEIRLTRRGRVVLVACTLLVTVALTWALITAVNAAVPSPSLLDGTASATPAPTRPAAPRSAAPTGSASPTPKPSASSATPTATPSAKTPVPTPATEPTSTLKVSDTPSTKKYVTSTLTRPASVKTQTLHTYVVKVETSIDLDANAVAGQIHTTLTDRRGWSGFEGHSFALVTADQKPEFTIYLASPKTVDALCAPATPHSTWNCRVGDRVVLNIDRWLGATPTWQARPIAEYRAYMVNHEIGHYVGRGHVPCRGKGKLAPVMMQQSIALGGCVINAWPRPTR